MIAHPEGDIDLSNADELRLDLLQAIDSETWHLLLDLSDVRYMDSSGVRVLFDLAKLLQTKRRRMGIVLAKDSPLEKLFKVTHVNEAALVCTSIDECLDALGDQS